MPRVSFRPPPDPVGSTPQSIARDSSRSAEGSASPSSILPSSRSRLRLSRSPTTPFYRNARAPPGDRSPNFGRHLHPCPDRLLRGLDQLTPEVPQHVEAVDPEPDQPPRECDPEVPQAIQCEGACVEIWHDAFRHER